MILTKKYKKNKKMCNVVPYNLFLAIWLRMFKKQKNCTGCFDKFDKK